MTRESPIIDVINLLYRSKDVIDDIYHNRAIEFEESSQHQSLLQTRLAIKKGSDQLRLSRQLISFLEFAMSKDKMVKINNNLSAHIEALRVICLSAQDEPAHSVARDGYIEAFEDELLEIEDELETTIVDLCTRIDRGFAMTDSWKKRSRENEYYLHEISKLIESLHLTRDELTSELFTYDDVFSSKIDNLILKFVGFHSRIQEAQKTISNFLFTRRVLSEKYQKIKSVARFVTENPMAKLEGALDAAPKHPSFLAIVPTQMAAFPDINDPRLTNELALILSSTQKREREKQLLKPVVDREESALDTFENSIEDNQVVWIENTINQFIYLAKDDPEPLSALTFWEDHNRDSTVFCEPVDKDAWTWYVISFFDAEDRLMLDGSNANDLVKLTIKLISDEEFSGNHYIDDLTVNGA